MSVIFAENAKRLGKKSYKENFLAFIQARSSISSYGNKFPEQLFFQEGTSSLTLSQIPKKKLRLDWAGGLKEFRGRYTSLELQKKSLEWWGD